MPFPFCYELLALTYSLTSRAKGEPGGVCITSMKTLKREGFGFAAYMRPEYIL